MSKKEEVSGRIQSFIKSKRILKNKDIQITGIREYVGIANLILFLESLRNQVAKKGFTSKLDIFNEMFLRRYPLQMSFRRLIYDVPLNDVSEEVIAESENHFVDICNKEIEALKVKITPVDTSFRELLDPDGLLKEPIEWDIYLYALKAFGLGIDDELGAERSNFYQITIEDIISLLQGKYSHQDLSLALEPSSNIFSSRVLLVDLSSLSSDWKSISPIISPYIMRIFKSTVDHNVNLLTEEITPRYQMDELILSDSTKQDIASLCRAYKDSSEETLTFLFLGESGVGKTTLAHALATELEMNILRINLMGKEHNLTTKMKYICSMAAGRKFVLLFDEADSLFYAGHAGDGPSGWARILFQEFKGVAVFTTNYPLPYGFDRRMTYSVKMQDLKPKDKSSLIEKIASASKLELNKKQLDVLSSFDLSPGYYENIFRVALASGPLSYDSLLGAFRTRSEFLKGEATDKSGEVKSNEKLFFDEVVMKQLEPITNGIVKYKSNPDLFPKGMKVAFTGPPGVGKTAFAKSIADDQGMDLKIVTPSDLLGMYVGQSEKAVRSLFRNSDDTEKKIIFIDEAESLFVNRNLSTQSWQLSLTNEMLTRFDAYQGIVIAATNRWDMLDPAFKRRFLLHVEISRPSQETRAKMWRYRTDFTEEQVAIVSRFDLSGADIADICFKCLVMQSVSFEELLTECRHIIESRNPIQKTIGFI